MRLTLPSSFLWALAKTLHVHVATEVYLLPLPNHLIASVEMYVICIMYISYALCTCIYKCIHAHVYIYMYSILLVYMYMYINLLSICIFQQKQLQLPELQPVNLLENRNILPTQPLEHPLPSLPGHLVSHGPDPGVFCCSMNSIPATSSLLNKMKLPLAIHIHPFKDSKAKVIYMYTIMYTYMYILIYIYMYMYTIMIHVHIHVHVFNRAY